jgi:putative hydrolase of the HAD superfamily
VRPTLPPVLLLDLDDTIVDDSGTAPGCWRDACVAHAGALGDLDPAALHESIARVGRRFWADPERHRVGRLDLHAARTRVAAMALEEEGRGDPALAERIAARYGALRDERLRLFPDAVETIEWLRGRGHRLAMITNGAGSAQRYKIERFDLARHFERILIEGEMGIGKPDVRVFERAVAAFDIAPEDAWMVGDNLDWDVVPPQSLGIGGVWIDHRGGGVPKDHPARPDRILRRLSDLRHGGVPA